MEEIVERGYVVVGSPDEVADQLRAVATELHVGHLMLLLQFGNMGRELAMHNGELFMERVQPQLRDLFEPQASVVTISRQVTPRMLLRRTFAGE